MNTAAPVKKIEMIRSQAESNLTISEDVAYEFAELKAALKSQIKAAERALEAYMVKNGLENLGCYTMASKKTWSITGKLAPRFYKTSVNTTKLNSMVKLGEKLPKGVTFTSGSYMTKTNRRREV